MLIVAWYFFLDLGEITIRATGAMLARLGSGHMSEDCVRDTTGAIRIRHKAIPSLTPCNCRCRFGEQACRKKYCPCVKAGFYCGPSCKCRHHDCNNRVPQDDETGKVQEPETCNNEKSKPKRQKTTNHETVEKPLTEAQLVTCEEILAHATEIDLSGLLEWDD